MIFSGEKRTLFNHRPVTMCMRTGETCSGDSGERGPVAATTVCAARQMVPDPGQGVPRTDATTAMDDRLLQQQWRRRRPPAQPSVSVLPVQTGARRPPDDRAQTRVRCPGRWRTVPGRRRRQSDVVVSSADATAQGQDGPTPRRFDRHHCDHVQVQVRAARSIAREQPLIRSCLILLTRSFVQVSIVPRLNYDSQSKSIYSRTKV